MKIKVKCNEENLPKFINKGEWVDLYVAQSTKVDSLRTRNKTPEVVNIPLGVAIKLPKGYEAIVAPRSSTASKYGILMANSFGIIDNVYSGNNDEWKFPAIAIKSTYIEKGVRICQFRIQLSQKATMWQKLKWLFSNKIEIVRVENLDDIDRGGFGSTGTHELK